MRIVANDKNMRKQGERLLKLSPQQRKDICTVLAYHSSPENIAKFRYQHSSFMADTLEKVNAIMRGYGVESLYPEHPEVHYVNMGDTYAITILHDAVRGKFYIGDWGSYFE